MGEAEQPAREQNIQAITDYYASGVTDGAGALGIELEHTLSHADGSQVAYEGDSGAEQLMREMSGSFPEPMIEDGQLLGVAGAGKTITLEPAAQLELSAGPFVTLQEAAQCMQEFERELGEVCARHNISVETPGYNLRHRACDLALIPKERYALMNEYLGAISFYGICMMRGSASTQISIDYTSADDCLRKLRLANACVPLFSLISDNSPVFEGKPRAHRLVRTKIWEECDPDRCGTVPGVMEPGFTWEDYAAYVLDTPAIVEKTPAGDAFTTKTFGELFAQTPMERADVEHAISMLFNDVRLKTYIEIRPADAMPPEHVIAYAALVKGLFYGAGSLNALDALFDGVSEPLIQRAKHALMQDGYAAMVYGHPASELADELISIAATGLTEDEAPYLEPLATLVARRTTLADLAES